MTLLGQKPVQAQEATRFDELVKLGFIGRGGIAIDGGAHVGSWTVKMAEWFDKVHAFEPCLKSYRMLEKNCETLNTVVTHYQALLDKNCKVNSVRRTPKLKALTSRQVVENNSGDVPAIALDALNLPRCDFIKLDLEGSEYKALLGARETILKYKPFLVIEFNINSSKLYNLIKSYGYKQVWSNDVDRGFN